MAATHLGDILEIIGAIPYSFSIMRSQIKEDVLRYQIIILMKRKLPNMHRMVNKAAILEKITFEYSSDLPKVAKHFCKEPQPIRLESLDEFHQSRAAGKNLAIKYIKKRKVL